MKSSVDQSTVDPSIRSPKNKTPQFFVTIDDPMKELANQEVKGITTSIQGNENMDALYQYIDLYDSEGFENALLNLDDGFIFSGSKGPLLHYVINKYKENKHSKLSEIILLLLTSQHCTEKFLALTDNVGNTALMVAAYSTLSEIVDHILEHAHCNQQLLLHTNKNKVNILLIAAAFGMHEIVVKILNSEYCTPALYNQVSIAGNTALISASCVRTSLGNHIRVINAILNSHYCTKEFVKKSNRDGINALSAASDPAIASTILASHYCTTELLMTTDDCGKHLLIYLAEKMNVKHFYNITHTILKSPHCTKDCITHTDNRNRNALFASLSTGSAYKFLDLLVETGHFTNELLQSDEHPLRSIFILALTLRKFEFCNTFLSSSYCTPEFLNIQDEEGKTALNWAEELNNRLLFNKIKDITEPNSRSCSLM